MYLCRFLRKTIIALIRYFFSLYSYQKKVEFAKISNILVVRLDEIGDMVLMSPFLRELRRNYPDAHITLVIKPAVFNLVELCPYVDEILPFVRPNGRFFTLKIILKTFLFAKKHLWKKCWDLAIVPRWDSDASYGAGWIAFFSCATRRVGYSEHVHPGKAIADYGFDSFYTDIVDKRETKHEVERNFDILRSIKCRIENPSLETWINDREKEYAKLLLSDSPSSFIRCAIVPSAGSQKREWDIESICKVIKNLSKQYAVSWIILGADERAKQYARIISSSCKEALIVDLIQMTSLRETIAILQECDIYIGGDTGPMHLAAACHLQGVVLSCHPKGADSNHPNAPERFGPWQSNFLILRPDPLPGCEHGCTEEFAHCINQISVDSVTEALMNLLENIRLKR